MLGGVQLAYQNLDSVELGITTVDHYFDTLGGISRAATRAKGQAMPVYIGDQTRGGNKVRTLAEQVAAQQEVMRMATDAGFLMTHTCAPYLVGNVPLKGEICTVESKKTAIIDVVIDDEHPRHRQK